MSDYDRKVGAPVPTTRWGSSSWMAGAAIGVLLLIAAGYVFSDRSVTSSPMVEHGAATTGDPAPVKPLNTPMAAPAPTNTPAATPKP